MTVQINKNKSKKLNSNRKQDFKFHFFFYKAFYIKIKTQKNEGFKKPYGIFSLFAMFSR
jgi:hypothetical protein